ncbi:MAG: MerR family DNA-binding transcriptional regulator [Rhodospirillales bacterium]|nr:MerR family DNA-binding transcriptional regulator [Rhodospirillales bacterium]
MTETFGIAELAKEFGVTTRTVRFYEDKGLISPTREGQRRVYSPRDRVRLRLIMRGKRLGLTLDEIAELINLYDVDPSEVTQLKQFIGVIHERKTVLEGQKQDIEDILAEMNRLERQCTQLLSQKQNKK